jgi:exosome complex RNA-binding protein Csl4
MYGLNDLVEEYGSLEKLMETTNCGSVPSICTECGNIEEMEPDQEAGYCSNCGKNEVKSWMILSGVI